MLNPYESIMNKLARLALYDKAAIKFIEKVDNKEARSTVTYRELKEALTSGRAVRCYQPGLGPDLSRYSGSITLEGPHYPQPHKWYARAILEDGLVIKVS